MKRQHLTIPADHPSLPGHFPGNPIVPGVVILDEVLAAAAAWWPEFAVGEVASVKFLIPLRPGQGFELAMEPTASGQLRFTCRRDGRTLASGSLRPREA